MLFENCMRKDMSIATSNQATLCLDGTSSVTTSTWSILVFASSGETRTKSFPVCGHSAVRALLAREKAPFRGTTLYASLASHYNKDLAPKDDLYSIIFMFIDLIHVYLSMDQRPFLGPTMEEWEQEGERKGLPHEGTLHGALQGGDCGDGSIPLPSAVH